MSDNRFDIRQYVEEKLDQAKPSAGSHGQEMTGVCPACRQYGGFYVNVDTGSYVCFKCPLRGRRIAGLVEVIEGISYGDACGFVFRRSVPMRRRETILTLRERLQALRPHVEQEATLITVMDDALPSAMRPCYVHTAGKDVWQLPPYLKERRIKSATVKDWQLGYVPKGTRHTKACWEAGEEKCIASCSWRYGGRLIIPVRCPNGRSFTARDMLGHQHPKYLNPTGTDFRRMLIGWELARLTGDLVICEGPLDAVKLYQHSISAVALGGKELHDEQLSMLMSLPSNTVITIMLDPEEAEAPLKVATRLSCHFTEVYIAKLLEVDGAAMRGLDSDGEPSKLDPGNSTSIEAYEAIDNATKWTGVGTSRLAAKLAKSRAAAASRWS